MSLERRNNKSIEPWEGVFVITPSASAADNAAGLFARGILCSGDCTVTVKFSDGSVGTDLPLKGGVQYSMLVRAVDSGSTALPTTIWGGL